MKKAYHHLIATSAFIALLGYILSGPVGFAIVQLIGPQPAWHSPAVFAENYSQVQDLPFYFGFLLIGGMLMLVSAHYLNWQEEGPMRFRLLLALGLTVTFVALIAFNYICQTTFIRNLALNYRPEYDAAIAAFSMANPLSFSWANEMWGYGFLGVATWLMAGYYSQRNRLVFGLLVANGPLSILGVFFTIISVDWLLTTGGLIAYGAWNVLMIAMMVAIYRDARSAIKS